MNSQFKHKKLTHEKKISSGDETHNWYRERPQGPGEYDPCCGRGRPNQQRNRLPT